MKLVRDRIPDIINEQGKTCSWYWVEDNEQHRHFLKLKMLEEVDEFIDNPSYEEAADVFEVFRSFCMLHGLDIDNVSTVATKKRQERGGFMGGIVLEHVDNES
jgi:predicted house-cleaning noncanonical NTP pyrophosphatase (MazG superfamily)